MRVVFVGAVETSAALLRAVLDTGVAVAAVVTLPPAEGRRRHADYVDLAPICSTAGISCLRAGDNGSLADVVRDAAPDLLLVWGWSALVPKAVIGNARLGGIGFHPSPLPIGRGRHPLIWSIILGLEESAVSFFALDEGADTGAILAQRRFAISPDETARSLMDKVKDEAAQAVPELLTGIRTAGKLAGMPQDENQAVSWRKRSPADGRIDFRMAALDAERLVRALARPYPGATATLSDGEAGAVWRARTTARPENSRWAEPGRVIGLAEDGPIVACGQDALVLTEHDFTKAPQPGAWFC